MSKVFLCPRENVNGLGRVLKKSEKVLRRVLKKVGKVRVGLNKIALNLVGEKY